MSGIKRTPADDWFSKCVRIRVEYHCERCGKQHLPNSQGLHCSHHYSRRHWSIRLDPLGSEALCYGCHSQYGDTEERRLEVLGERAGLLRELRDNTDRGREYKRTPMKILSAHYRSEFRRMQAERDRGVTGRIEFVGYL